MTRRTFVQLVAVLVTAVAALASVFSLHHLRRLMMGLVRPRLDSSSRTGNLAPPEMQSVLAFAEILVEQRQLDAVARQILVDHIGERTRHTAGYLSLYRTTARLLDNLAGRSFASLEFQDRVALITEHRLGQPVRRTREYLVPFGREELTVRTLVVRDLIRGYYRSPAGWAIVGYAAFPGQCGDLMRYTRPEP